MARIRTMRSTASKKYEHSYKAPKAYDIEMREGESELQYYKRLAKAADQRLVRLEKLSQQEGFKGVKQYAYARAMYDISIYGKGKRFNTALPKDEETGEIDRRIMKERIMSMRDFLTSVTSTKAGIQETYVARVNTINEKYGTQYTWQQFADFIRSSYGKKTMKKVDSDLVLKAIAKVQQARKMLDEMENNKQVSSENPINDLAIKFLESKTISGDLTPEQKRKMRALIRGM